MKRGIHLWAAMITVVATGVAVVGLNWPSKLLAEPPAATTTAPQTNVAAGQTNSVEPKAEQPAPPPVKARHQLTGAELYSINCNRCHPERYPTERTAAQWKTIMLHMQVRANLPVSQARLILKYLQDNSGR